MNADFNEKLAAINARHDLSVEAAKAIKPLHNERLKRIDIADDEVLVIFARDRGNETGRGSRWLELEPSSVIVDGSDQVAWTVKSDTFICRPTGPISAKTGYGPQIIKGA